MEIPIKLFAQFDRKNWPSSPIEIWRLFKALEIPLRKKDVAVLKNNPRFLPCTVVVKRVAHLLRRNNSGIIPDGLVAQYSLDEGSGSTVSDSAGGHADGIVLGGLWDFNAYALDMSPIGSSGGGC